MTYAAKAEGLVQNFAARWCSIRKHPIQYKTSNQEQQCKTHLKKGRKHNTPIIIKKRIQTNKVKTIIILIFTSKRNKNDQAAQFARQKEQRKP
jgi:hypothetical protein